MDPDFYLYIIIHKESVPHHVNRGDIMLLYMVGPYSVYYRALPMYSNRLLILSYKGRYTVTVHGGGPIVSTIGPSPCAVTDYHIHAPSTW